VSAGLVESVRLLDLGGRPTATVPVAAALRAWPHEGEVLAGWWRSVVEVWCDDDVVEV
jgi:hypothetical protein